MHPFAIRGGRAWALFVAFWLVSTLAIAAGQYAFRARQAASRFFGERTIEAPSWWPLLGDHLGVALLGAAGALIGLAAAARLPLGGGRWRRNLPLHLLLGIAVVTAQSAVVFLLSLWLPFVAPLPFTVRLQTSPAALFFYAVWVGLGYALIHSREYRIRDLEAATRRAQLVRARLNAVRSEPHSRYLADVLAALADLLRRRASEAGALLSRLADFLRLSMESSRLGRVPLAEEIALVESYLEVERLAGRQQLEVEWRIDPETLDLSVPHPVLQRLAEAAVRGGRGSSRAPRRLVISAAREGPSLRLSVTVDPATPEAVGATLARLESLRESLEHLFASDFALRAEEQPAGTLRVVLVLPAETLEESAVAPVGDPEETARSAVAPPRPAGDPDPFRSRAAWLLLGGWWTGLALFFSNMYYVSSALRGSPIGVGHALQIGFIDMYLWAAVCLVAFALARRLPIDGGRWRTSVPIHVAIALVLLPGRLLVEVWIATHTAILAPVPLTGKLLFQGPSHATAYAFLVAIGYAIDYYRRAREREIAAWETEAQVVQAQLSALKMQLHPHFLFNALNAVATLGRVDPAQAAGITKLLETLLRSSLSKGDAHEVTLGEEVEFLRTYLAIEQVRHGDRLRVRWRVDPEALDARVPHLILQPLVENAIRHGVAPVAERGTIEVLAAREGAELVLQVSDDGVGFDPDRPRRGPRAGVGLANTRERLAWLYRGTRRLDIQSRPGEGTTVTLRIPLRLASAAPAEPPAPVLQS